MRDINVQLNRGSMINKEINGGFNKNFCSELRDLVSSTNVFWKDKKEHLYYNHLCAMMDRVDDSMGYIFSHIDVPKTSDEYLLFLIHSCIVIESIKKVMGLLGLQYAEYVKKLPKYLSIVIEQLPVNGEIDLSDDDIFKYLRSISFAHPLDTDKGFLKRLQHTKHCSPFLMVGRGLNYKGHVGVYVYSSTPNDTFSIQVPYTNLVHYVYDRYCFIKYIIRNLKDRLRKKEERWMQHKINRNQSPELILAEIKSILEERYVKTYDIEELIGLLTCKYTRPENDNVVNLVKEELIKRIPAICDAIDNMDIDAAYNVYKEILFDRPAKMHDGAGYELEKIFCYLTDNTRYINQEFGKIMARLFTKGFASKWVVMDIDNMTFEEIQMLTRIACFMEKREQDEQKLHKTVSK